MIAWRAGVVTECRARWDGACESTVALDGDGGTVRALSYPHLVGELVPGARVMLNATALLRGLGTGGYALVVARTDALVPDPLPRPGHLVKARYTPLQAMVLGVDDQESPHHAVLRDADDLAGLPVVVADLHSALPAVVAGARVAAARAGRAAPRVAYVMTDGGALPAWFSRAVDGLRDAGWIDACVTTGQAFGGDHEAVTVHTGLLAARHVVGADLVVVAQGPGNLGTGTRWGFSGVAAGEALNAAAVLGGLPVASLRVSGADARERHLGVSHHSLTAYGRVALAPAHVVVPALPPDLPGTPRDLMADPDPGAWSALADRVAAQAATLTAPAGRHRAVTVEAGTELLDALRGTPVRLSTMGRGLDADPAAFLAAAAAGAYAVTATGD
ncbi:protein of unknown function DUF952 [Cellulomonas flavigena DSM 20109]|uniref:DUF3866 domain-containing protein n=1 Tax=Cellulomonas flavigena (strain ATCC 482 / DSM 20109 / BCRC 11376 / JCM 18109 / NBRC 3775 / NCIMB 8073 / NRS 134) TaxID=446466 RepID=D5UEV2_CELFN|nr:DUF3866 family protein [Cellulomonas flavigena]ADG74762.1 protein of unknown function DUF952 [Cellulomonas flavigena DSM 20109]